MLHKLIGVLVITLFHTQINAQYMDGSPSNDYSEVFDKNLPNRATSSEELKALKEVMKVAATDRSPYVLLQTTCLYHENYEVLVKNGYQVYQRKFTFAHNVDYITIFKGVIPTGHNYPEDPIDRFCTSSPNAVTELKD
jgi:hypothetical protein